MSLVQKNVSLVMIILRHQRRAISVRKGVKMISLTKQLERYVIKTKIAKRTSTVNTLASAKVTAMKINAVNKMGMRSNVDQFKPAHTFLI